MSKKTHPEQAALHAYLDRQNQCMAMPPHPSLQGEMEEILNKMKEENKLSAFHSRLGFSEQAKAGFNDGLIYPGNLFPLGTSEGPVKSARSDQPAFRGKIRLLVVLVDFPDQPMATPNSRYEDLFFSTGKIPSGSVNEYYKEVSNGKVDIIGDVIGPFRMPQPITYYANNGSGIGNRTPNARTMARDATLALPAGIRLADYDNDQDGFVDAFIVVHAGVGAETTNKSYNIWSHKWVIEGNAFTAPPDTTQIYAYLTVPEDSRIGVCAHELGHLLFGFPDLYDGTGKSYGAGRWCLMAGGSWNNKGDTPAHPSAWCKIQQRWVRVDTPKSNSKGLVLQDVKQDFTVKKLWKNGLPSNEYFLLENRQPTGFDKNLPGAGLLIWHIDDTIQENNNPWHYKVGLVQADGKYDLENNKSAGDTSDPFPGSAANINFNSSTTPASLSFGGLDSGVQVNNIRQNGNDIICDISIM